MNKNRYKIRKLIIIAASQLVLMTGCGGIKTSNDISEVYTPSEENSAIEKTIVVDTENLPECNLSDENFEIEYQGYVINELSSPEDIEKSLGYPIQGQSENIRILFNHDLFMDETYPEYIQLYNVETSRGITVGDSLGSVYELYGQPTKERRYSEYDGYSELCYVKDDKSITFGIDKNSRTVIDIFVRYNVKNVYIRYND